MRRVLALEHRLVLDGGVVDALAQRRPRFPPGRAVLTPHPGEWRRLAAGYRISGDPLREERRPAAALALAEASGAGWWS